MKVVSGKYPAFRTCPIYFQVQKRALAAWRPPGHDSPPVVGGGCPSVHTVWRRRRLREPERQHWRPVPFTGNCCHVSSIKHFNRRMLSGSDGTQCQISSIGCLSYGARRSRWLKMVTYGYIWLQMVTDSFRCLQMATYQTLRISVVRVTPSRRRVIDTGDR